MSTADAHVQALLAVLARGYAFELEDPDELWVQGFKPVNGLPGKITKYQA